MRLFLILLMVAVAMAWRNVCLRRQKEEAQRQLLLLLAEQAADEVDAADREISDNIL